MNRPEYLTIHEAAALARCSSRTIRRLIASGALPAGQIGRLVRIRRVDLECQLSPRVAEARAARPRGGGTRAVSRALALMGIRP